MVKLPRSKEIISISKVLNVSEAWFGYNVNSDRPTDEERQLSHNKQIIAAHIDDDVTDEEMKQIINFINFIKDNKSDK